MVKSTEEGYIKVTGGNVWYKIVGNKKGTPLVMLHGGPGFPSDALQTLDALSKNNQLIFYDQLGCGRSDRPQDKSLWKKERFVDELETIRQTLNIDHMHLLGHSWGSMLAVMYALQYPKRVKSLILSGPFLSVKQWIDDANKLKQKLPLKIQNILNQHETSGTTDSEEYKKATLAFYKKHLCRMDPFPQPMQKTAQGAGLDVYLTMWGPTEFHCTGNLKGFDLTSKLHNITVPVLLLCGKYDEATPETTQYYASLFPHAQIKVFKKSAHAAYLEEKENYIKTVKDFLKSVS